jgi:hypothetical protein
MPPKKKQAEVSGLSTGISVSKFFDFRQLLYPHVKSILFTLSCSSSGSISVNPVDIALGRKVDNNCARWAAMVSVASIR